MLYACDQTWWDHYFPKLATGFPGELWTVSEGARDLYGLAWVMSADQSGLSKDPTMIHTGRNSGTQAVALAHLFGARRIVLLGFDMAATNGRAHWHGDHPKGLGNGAQGRYSVWIRSLELVAQDAKRDGLQIINASRRTALRCFPRVELEEALT